MAAQQPRPPPIPPPAAVSARGPPPTSGGSSGGGVAAHYPDARALAASPAPPSPPSLPPAAAPPTHLASHPFAERFLPPPVDASHVISSAAPTSLPIELPALRAGSAPDGPTDAATAAAPGAPPAPSPPSAATPAASARAPSAAHQHGLTPFERWTLRASESQFNALAGAVGGFTSGIFTCPLDVIKTKLQAQGGFAALQRQQQQQAGLPAGAAGQTSQQRLYNGLVGTARVIWRDEGVRGLYRGLGPIIMGYLPTWAVWFTVYNKSKIWMGERYQNTFVINFWSSIVAGASSTIVTNPIWVIKTRLMSQMPSSHDRPGMTALPRGGSTPTSRPTLSTPWHYRSTLDAARKMYTTEGVLSFYSGLTPALLGLTHVAVQFPAYEYFKTKFTGRGMGDSAADGDGAAPVPAHWLGVLSATILSKVLASSLTYPHEVIRTRLQTQRRRVGGGGGGSGSTGGPLPRYRGVVTTFRTILREEGWRAFYAGMGTNMMRAVPAATVTMLTYEYVMRSLKQTRHDARLQQSADRDAA